MQARINWAFAERCEAATSAAAVLHFLVAEIGKLGFSHVACMSHVDPLRPPAEAVALVNYPEAWLARFSERRYAERDPVFHTARAQSLPFQWSDPRFLKPLEPDQRAILQEAGEFGLGDGFTIPLNPPNALPASCSLVIGPDGVDPLNVNAAHWYALYAHETARRFGAQDSRGSPRLGRREKQVLEFIARGKSDFEVSVILGLSEHTIHNAVRRVMLKYGVATRMQAVIRALKAGEILLEAVAD